MSLLDQLTNQRNTVREQYNQSMTPITGVDAQGYLNQRVDGFRPLLQEQQSLNSQANQSLPDGITKYLQQRQQNPNNGASAMSMLNSIFANKANIQGQANVVGGVIDSARGRLGDISNSALDMLRQQQQGFQSQYSMLDQDVIREQARVEAERQRREALAEAERQRAFQMAEAEKARQAQARENALNMRASQAQSQFNPKSIIDQLLAGSNTKLAGLRQQKPQMPVNVDQPITVNIKEPDKAQNNQSNWFENSLNKIKKDVEYKTLPYRLEGQKLLKLFGM